MTTFAPAILASFEAKVKDTIGGPRYDLWFNGHTKIELEEGTLRIGVPNRYYREWLESHFQDAIRTAAEAVFGEALPVRFRIDPALYRHNEPQRPAELTRSAATAIPTRAAPLRPSRFGLSRFLVSISNKVGHAAASAFIEDPRDCYSPLFIYGGTGLGKTHLLKAIEEGVRQRHGGVKVRGLCCEEFTNLFVEALRGGDLHGFRRKFRQTDLLLVDDIHFLVGKKATQEEFLHTLNALEIRGAKVVLAAGEHPRRLTKIPEELRARFLSGMVAKLEPPNRELRRQILRTLAVERSLELRSEVLDFLADNLRSNVCELEGAVNYLALYSETHSKPIDLDASRTALGDILRHSVPVLRVDEVKKKACDLFSLNPAGLRQRCRSRAVAHPRMLVLYLARKYTQATYAEIGQEIGGLNHATVIAAQKKIDHLLQHNGEIVLGGRAWKVRDAVEAFERELGSA